MSREFGEGEFARDARRKEDGLNEQLQTQLAELLKALMASAQSASTWTTGQIPLLVQEKIAFGRVWATVSVLVFAALAFGGYRVIRLCIARCDESDYGSTGWEALGVATGIAESIFVVCAFISLRAALVAWFAPRLYIVEWLMGMVKS